MASAVFLQSLGNGVLWDAQGNALNGHQVFVLKRGATDTTTASQVSVYSDSGLTHALSQPLLTGPASGAAPGGIPGYVAAEQAIDLYDATSLQTVPAEPLAVHDVVADPSGNGTADWAVIKEAPLNVEWAEYGASPTASASSNVTAINAAVAALPANGGEILLPRRYPTNGTIVLDGRENIRLRGAAGQWNGASGIDYAGTGTAVSIRGTGGSTDGCVLENLAISDAANTAAILVDLGTSSSTPSSPGSSNCKLSSVFLNGNAGTATLLNLAQAISGSFSDVAFNGGNVAVQGVALATSSGGFSNTHAFRACYFSGQKVIPIQNPLQNWSLVGCTFEPMSGGVAGAILCTTSMLAAGLDGLTLVGNSFQDGAAGNTGDWLTVFGSGISIVGNLFLNACARHVLLEGSSGSTQGLAILGNVFAGATTYAVDLQGLAPTQTVILGNSWNNGGLDVNSNPGAGSFVSVPAMVGITSYGYSLAAAGPVDVETVGEGLRVAEGANAKQGVATLAAGTVTVANTSVTASSRIMLTVNTPGGAVGSPYISGRTPGTSFTIASTSATDTSTVAYQIFEPG